MTAPVTQIMRDIKKEWLRQRLLWGEQHHPDGCNPDAYKPLADNIKKRNDLANENDMINWLDILQEEVYEAFAESEWPDMRKELIESAAVIVSWVEDGDSR